MNLFRSTCPILFTRLAGVATILVLGAMVSAQSADAPEIPAWEYPGAYPGHPNNRQVPPPADFHRDGKNFDTSIGIFTGQSDIGGPFVPGSASFDPASKKYSVTSAGYNIWYTRDEFRYLWTKMSGDVSLAASINLVNSNQFGDCKAVLMIRQDLDDGSKEVLVGQHGAGMIQLGQRPEKNIRVKDTEYRIGSRGPTVSNPDNLVTLNATRVGLEKRGDEFTLYVSLAGEPLHPWGPPVTLHLDGPFYVGIGFCSHQPDKPDTAVFSDVVLENAAGKAK